jgi:transcriptional regulator with XRE-family HTH domain
MFGNRFVEFRKYLKISQTKLANELGTSQTVIFRYEKGERVPDVIFLEKLQNKFNVNLNWLINGKGEMFINDNIVSKLNLIESEIMELKKELRV